MWNLQPCSFTCCWSPSCFHMSPQGFIPQLLLGLSKDGKLPEREGDSSMDMRKNELQHMSNHLHIGKEAMALPWVTFPQGVVFHSLEQACLHEGEGNLLPKPPLNWCLPHILLEKVLSSSSAGNTPVRLMPCVPCQALTLSQQQQRDHRVY